MILKVDHLAFGSSRFDGDVRRFLALGYTLEFQEAGLRDLNNKRPLLQRFSGQVDMAFLTRPGSLSIEILNHGHALFHPTWLFPIMEMESCQPVNDSEGLSWGDRRLVQCRSEAGEVFARRPAPEDPSCDAVIVESESISSARTFWEAFGFRCIREDDVFTELAFRSFFSQATARLLLRERKGGASPYWLDTQGFNCLAFFCSDPVRDRDHFRAQGYSTSEIEPFSVNSKQLQIFWVHGPGGEIVEIIGWRKT